MVTQHQEATRKDVERAIGSVSISVSDCEWSCACLVDVYNQTYVILHNMIMEGEWHTYN